LEKEKPVKEFLLKFDYWLNSDERIKKPILKI